MTNEAMSEKEKCWHEFYNSKEAQDYCFGNYNNATRDESVGEFSFSGGWDACVKKAIDKEKLIEWINIQTTFDSNEKLEFIKDITERIVSGEFNLK